MVSGAKIAQLDRRRNAAAAVVSVPSARAQKRRQWVEAKRGASDGRSGALRAAHRGSMMPVMMAAPSRGCSADSGDSSVKTAAAQPMDELVSTEAV